MKLLLWAQVLSPLTTPAPQSCLDTLALAARRLKGVLEKGLLNWLFPAGQEM